MKTIAALALLGAVSTYDLRRLTNQDKLFATMALFDDDSLVQTGKVLETTAGSNVHGGWGPEMHEFPGTQNEYGDFIQPYERVLPERFVGDAAQEDVVPVDKFTQNLIENYATEGQQDKEDGGAPTGVFFLTKSQAKSAARETLATNKGLKGEALTKYLDTYFDKAWGHFDVNQVGSIASLRMAEFIRFLASDQYMSIG